MDRSLEQPMDIRGSARADPKIQNATEVAHETTEKVARAATVQVDRLRGTAHDAVEGAASLVVEHGGYGGSLAAPIARRVVEAARDLAILPSSE